VPGHGHPDFMGGGPPEPPRPGIGVDLRNLIILLMIVAVIIGAFRQCHYSKGTEDKIVSAPEDQPTSTPQDRPTSTPQDRPTSTPQERPTSTPQEGSTSTPEERSTSTPQEKSSSPEAPQSKRATRCLTATQRMDKNGVLPRDYSINCPYWQWWSHKPTQPRSDVQPSPDQPHSSVQPSLDPPRTEAPRASDPPRTRVLPEPDPPRTQVPPETEPPRMHLFPDPESTRREREALRYRRERDWCCCRF
jgi:hypothetical protein